jgi:pantoate--beta-alanine ligase
VETIHTIEWMKQAARDARMGGHVIGLVPTMGALHEGHFSLIEAAKERCSRVVATIFVNPTQFGPAEDLAKYPRSFEADRDALEKRSVDFLFAPPAEEIYPKGFSTYVTVEGLSARLEGKSRPGHFRGVATVVLKLLEIVQPGFAFFGRKDAQQERVIRTMARDLNLDAQVTACPIVREVDGLALSSRNAYLSPDDRRAATKLSRSLESARKEIEAGERDVVRLIRVVREVLAREPRVAVDYAEIVDADTFEPVMSLRGTCYILLAATLGTTRLIDNALIEQLADGFRVTI